MEVSEPHFIHGRCKANGTSESMYIVISGHIFALLRIAYYLTESSDDRTNDYKTGFELQDNKPRSNIDGDKQEISSKTDDSEVTAEELEEHDKLEWWRNGSALSVFCRTCKGEEYGEDSTQTSVPYAAPEYRW